MKAYNPILIHGFGQVQLLALSEVKLLDRQPYIGLVTLKYESKQILRLKYDMMR